MVIASIFLAVGLTVGACDACVKDSGKAVESCGAEPQELKFVELPNGSRVSFVLTPTTNSYIRCEMYLPKDWDGRFWGYGNGGWAGKVAVETSGCSAAMHCDLGTSRRNRAVIGENLDVLADYSWRATHLATVAAKQLIRQHYGRLPDHSYFYGQSCGGRQGLAEALRFPEDYDGIVSGVPGLTERSRAGLPWKIAQLKCKYGKWFTKEEQRAVRIAELAYFAKIDPEWARGKFILDPNPTKEKLDGCWREIVSAMPALADREQLWRELFEPVMVSGRRIAPGMLIGIEFGGASSFLVRKYLGINEPAELTEGQLQQYIDLAGHWSVGEPDFSAFKARGGKLIMYSGLEDLSCQAAEISEFYDEAAKRLGGYASAREFFAYYVEPGRTHSAAGEASGNGQIGAPRNVEAAIVDWVEKGKDPGALKFDWNHEPKYLEVQSYPANRVSCK